MRMGVCGDRSSDVKDMGMKTHTFGVNETPITPSPWYWKPFIYSVRNPLLTIYLPRTVMESLLHRSKPQSPGLDKLDKGNEEFPLRPCPGRQPLRETPTGTFFLKTTLWICLFLALPCLSPFWQKGQNKKTYLSFQIRVPVVGQSTLTPLPKHTNEALYLQVPIV